MAPVHDIDAISRDVARALLDLRVRLGEMALRAALGDRSPDLSRIADVVDRLDESLTCVRRLKVSLGVTDAACDAECLLLEQVAVRTGRLVDALHNSVEHLSKAQVGRIRRFVTRARRVAARTLRGIVSFMRDNKWKTAFAVAFVAAMYNSPPNVQIDAEMDYPTALLTFVTQALVRPFCDVVLNDAGMGALFCYLVVLRMMGIPRARAGAPSDTVGWHWAVLYALLMSIGCPAIERTATRVTGLLTALVTKILEIGDWRELWSSLVGSRAEAVAAKEDPPEDPRVQLVHGLAEMVNAAFRDRDSLAAMARAGLGVLVSILTAHASGEIRSEDEAAAGAFRGRMVRKDALETAVACDLDALHALRAVDRLAAAQSELLDELGVPSNLPPVPRAGRPMPVVVVRDAPRAAGVSHADADPTGHARVPNDARRGGAQAEHDPGLATAAPRDAAAPEWCRVMRTAFGALEEGAYGVSPLTGRRIKKGGPAYRRLADACHVVAA